MAKTIREAVAQLGDFWRQALPDEIADVHRANECLAVVGSDSERRDFFLMKCIQGHPDESVRAFYRTYTPNYRRGDSE